MEEVYISYKGNSFVECKITIGNRAKFFFGVGFDGDNKSTSKEKTEQSASSKLTPSLEAKISYSLPLYNTLS
jgi:hypothetical protein